MINGNAESGSVGLRGVAGILGERTLSLAELRRQGLLESSQETLTEFGFERAHLKQDSVTTYEMACAAARQAMDDASLPPQDVDLVIWASARPESHVSGKLSTGHDDVMSSFRYAVGRLQDELGLNRADVLAVTQQGCATMFSAVRLARAMLLSEPGCRNVLCVGVDVLPDGGSREIMYNVISDGASAVVVSQGWKYDRLLGQKQISRGFYWDPVEKQAEIIAAYFPTAKRLIGDLLNECDLNPQNIDLVVPTGVNVRSWEILMSLVGIPADRLYRRGDSFGHTITSDNFIYLQRLRENERVCPGAKLLLFTYGFGSTWSGMILEH